MSHAGNRGTVRLSALRLGTTGLVPQVVGPSGGRKGGVSAVGPSDGRQGGRAQENHGPRERVDREDADRGAMGESRVPVSESSCGAQVTDPPPRRVSYPHPPSPGSSPAWGASPSTAGEYTCPPPPHFWCCLRFELDRLCLLDNFYSYDSSLNSIKPELTRFPGRTK